MPQLNTVLAVAMLPAAVVFMIIAGMYNSAQDFALMLVFVVGVPAIFVIGMTSASPRRKRDTWEDDEPQQPQQPQRQPVTNNTVNIYVAGDLHVHNQLPARAYGERPAAYVTCAPEPPRRLEDEDAAPPEGEPFVVWNEHTKSYSLNPAHPGVRAMTMQPPALPSRVVSVSRPLALPAPADVAEDW